MNKIFCIGCGRMLARLDGRAELKCPRCATLAAYDSGDCERTRIKRKIGREALKTQNNGREAAKTQTLV